MRKEQLHAALEQQFVPLVFDAQQQARVLSIVKGETKVKKKLSMAVVMAMIFVLIAATALAAAVGGDVLSYLIGQSIPTQEQQQSVQTVNVSAEQDGVRVTLNDCLYDGLRLSAGLTFETDEPVFCQDIQVKSPDGDIWMEFASPLQNWNINPATGTVGKRDRTSHGFLAYLSDELVEKAANLNVLSIEVTLYCMKPQKEIKCVEHAPEYNSPAYAAWQEKVDALFAEGYTVVYSSETGYEQLYPSAVSEGTVLEEMLENANLAAMEPIVLQFEVDVQKAMSAVRDITPNDVMNDGRYAFTFNQILLTPLTTWFDFTVIPNAPFTTTDELRELMQWFEFFDENREPLRFQDGEYMTGAGFEEREGGSLALVAEYPMPALAEIPEGIYIVPCNHLSGEPLWDYSVYIPVK